MTAEEALFQPNAKYTNAKKVTKGLQCYSIHGDVVSNSYCGNTWLAGVILHIALCSLCVLVLRSTYGVTLEGLHCQGQGDSCFLCNNEMHITATTACDGTCLCQGCS